MSHDTEKQQPVSERRESCRSRLSVERLVREAGPLVREAGPSIKS